MILVFGAGGQLGLELSAMAAETSTSLTGLTHDEADIADVTAVGHAMRSVRPSLVINAAAYNAVDRAEKEPEAAVHANASGPTVLASACAAAGAPLVHISTDYVFDGALTRPYREDDPIGPLSTYARSKAAGEDAVRRGTPAHVIVRTAWLYGVHGANFLKTMLRLAAERDALDIVADQTGSPTSTVDLTRGLLIAAAAIARGERPWGTYHLAGTGLATRYGFVSRIVAAQRPFTGRSPEVRPIASADFPAAAHRPKFSALDSGKFAATFGFRAAPWEEAVDHAVAALCRQTAAA